MAFDYTEISETAVELVAEFGRQVTFVELGDTPADPTKPWRAASAPRSSPKRTLGLMAVLVEPASIDTLGRESAVVDFVKRSTQIAIVATSEDLEHYNEVHDEDGSVWRIQGSSELKPGSTRLLYFVGLSK